MYNNKNSKKYQRMCIKNEHRRLEKRCKKSCKENFEYTTN